MPKRAIFLDRDGIINEEKKDYVKNLKEFKIYKDVWKAIKILKENDFLIVLITNQSAINRNLLNVQTLNEIHNHLQNYLKMHGTKIDAIYYCPHRPEENCICRKPKPEMILHAANDLDIELGNSWFIGDSTTDIEAAKAAGCGKYVLIDSSELLKKVKTIVGT